MTLMDNEKELFSGNADSLLFNTFRKSTVKLTITNQRIIVGKFLVSNEFLLTEVVSAERFKAMFLNIGIKFHLKNGKTVALATRHINNVVEVLQDLGKM